MDTIAANMNPTFQWCVWNVNVDTPIYVKTKFSIKKLSNSNNCKKKTVRHNFFKIDFTLPGDKELRSIVLKIVDTDFQVFPKRQIGAKKIQEKFAQMKMLLCLAFKMQLRKIMTIILYYNLITCFVLALDSTDRLLYV